MEFPYCRNEDKQFQIIKMRILNIALPHSDCWFEQLKKQKKASRQEYMIDKHTEIEYLSL